MTDAIKMTESNIQQSQIQSLKFAHTMSNSFASVLAFLFFIDPVIRNILSEPLSLFFAIIFMISALLLLTSAFLSTIRPKSNILLKFEALNITYIDTLLVGFAPTMIFTEALFLISKLHDPSQPISKLNEVISIGNASFLLGYFILLVGIYLTRIVWAPMEREKLMKLLKYFTLAIIIIDMILIGAGEIQNRQIFEPWYYVSSLFVAIIFLSVTIWRERQYTLILKEPEKSSKRAKKANKNRGR